MSYEEMELDKLGDRRTAMFVIISDTDDTFNFVVAIMYTQLFNLLCDKADDVYNGRLQNHMRLLLDEFARTSGIPEICVVGIFTCDVFEYSHDIHLPFPSHLSASA